jgi:hypothetical protein
VNPGLARIAIVVALVVAGVVVLTSGFSDEGTRAASSPSVSPTPSDSPSPSPTPDDAVVGRKEALVQVFNGTNVAGFAADFQDQLLDEGYIQAGEPADAPQKPVADSIVYFAPDDTSAQNEADARLLAEDYLEGAPVERLPQDFEGVDPAADVIVVLGEDVAPTT